MLYLVSGHGAASRAVVPEFVSLRRKRSESRMLEIGTSGLMSGDGKRVGGCMPVPAPILDSTCWLRRASTCRAKEPESPCMHVSISTFGFECIACECTSYRAVVHSAAS